MSLNRCVSSGDRGFTQGISGWGKGVHHSLTLSDYYHTVSFHCGCWVQAVSTFEVSRGPLETSPLLRGAVETSASLKPTCNLRSVASLFSCQAVLNCLLSHRAKTYPTKKTAQTIPMSVFEFSSANLIANGMRSCQEPFAVCTH